jgi:hypothetical protein
MEIELIPPGLYGEDGSTDGLCFKLALDVFLESLPGAADQFSQEASFPSKGRSENFGDSPDHLAVVDWFQYFHGHPFDKSRDPFSLAGGTKKSCFA